MSQQPDEFEDTWADLVPEQPDSRERWPLWLAIGAIVLVLACLCIAGGYFVTQEFFPELIQRPDPVIPTLPGTETVETGELATATAPVTPPPTIIISPSPSQELAPTATIVAEEPTEPATIAEDVVAIRLAALPIIDGNLDEWGGAPVFESAHLVYQDSGWDGTDDLTALWRLAWDVSNLYIGVEVADDVHVQTQTGNQIFRGDSVDMQFDTNRAGDLGPGLSPDDIQITFSPGDFATLPPSAFRFQGTADGQILDAPGGHHVILQTQQTATGYRIEAAIPWGDLNLTPAEGLVIGLALNANDNDSPGTAVQEVMKSHVATRTLTDPSGWGTLTLQ
ncbi:MAG: sugar-binding protein [Chloroflexota bacterium]|jgi:hypothetical protein